MILYTKLRELVLGNAFKQLLFDNEEFPEVAETAIKLILLLYFETSFKSLIYDYLGINKIKNNDHFFFYSTHLLNY